MNYANRNEAGRALAAALRPLRLADPLLLGLPRGGVPVAHALCDEIGGELDVLLVRKLGLPDQPELAMGAIGEDGIRLTNLGVVRSARVSDDEFAATEDRERAELQRRARLLRGIRPPIPLRGRTVVIVDDGMATGATAVVACRIARGRGADRIVLAVPVSSAQALDRLRPLADDVVCPKVPATFHGVGQAYHDFHQLADQEVTVLLEHPGDAAYAACNTNQ